VTYSPDARLIASGGSGVIKIWDAATGTELKSLSGHRYTIRSVAFTPDSKRIISGGYDATVRIWDIATGEEIAVLYGHNKNVEAVAVSPDGKRIVSGSFISVILWDVETGAELMTLPSDGSLAVSFSPDGKTIAAGVHDQDNDSIALWQSGTNPGR
jgi:WD40 repeat protein